MTHPTPGELLELYFGEAEAARVRRLAAHAWDCEACRPLLDDVAWAERLLAVAADEDLAEDDLARVFARIEAGRPAPAPRAALRAALPSAAAILAGALAVALWGAGAALAFFAAGTLVTLSLAPMLILETQKRGGAAAVR